MEESKPNMICHADHDLVGWKDFPRGLRVLLLVEDCTSAADIKSKLEQMDYTVSLFRDEKEALKAVSSKAEGFHVAIIEVTACNRLGCFRFLETTRGLPTIMVSEAQCISTMMKCIALGAAEFLQKPVSEEKLRNIWQHAVHKAFNAGSAVLSRSLKPIKETVASILHLQPDSGVLELNDQESSTMADAAGVDGRRHDEQGGSRPNDRFPAPSTPQLEQSGCRSPDDGDCEDYRLNCSIDESMDQVRDSIVEQTRLGASESKSVDDTRDNSAGEICKKEPSTPPADFSREDEIDSASGSKTDECAPPGDHLVPSPHLDHEGGSTVMQHGEDLNQKYEGSSTNLGGGRSNRKRMKVDWTPELHKRFVQAVEELGIDQAIPSKILELMKAEGLTRHNVASHLQKYRMRKRHILPKEEDRRWHQQQHGSAGHHQVARAAHPYKHFVALPPPPPHSRVVMPPAGQVCHVWGRPSSYHHHHPGGGVQIWGSAAYNSPWLQPSGEYWPWKTYPRMHADAWGCPVVASPQNPYPAAPQYYPPQNRSFDMPEHRNGASTDSYDFRPAEEVIDEVVREALSKPWLPLPLGLKPPSTESVLTELHRLGVHSVPPR